MTNQAARTLKLQARRWARAILSDRMTLRIMFLRNNRSWLNLRKPKTFNEKIQWYKLHEMHKPVYATLVDKLAVRHWVRDRIGDEYLIPIIGHWSSFDEIDTESLPDSFVLKCNHDSGSVLVCKDKGAFDFQHAREVIETGLATNYADLSVERQYASIERQVLCESLLEDDSGENLRDYRFYCFDGTPVYCAVEPFPHPDHRRLVYNMDWELQQFTIGYERANATMAKPAEFEKMRSLASALSNGFSHVRVDMYAVSGKIFFGEMTFTSGSGFGKFYPEESNRLLGDMWKVPALDR